MPNAVDFALKRLVVFIKNVFVGVVFIDNACAPRMCVRYLNCIIGLLIKLLNGRNLPDAALFLLRVFVLRGC